MTSSRFSATSAGQTSRSGATATSSNRRRAHGPPDLAEGLVAQTVRHLALQNDGLAADLQTGDDGERRALERLAADGGGRRAPVVKIAAQRLLEEVGNRRRRSGGHGGAGFPLLELVRGDRARAGRRRFDGPSVGRLERHALHLDPIGPGVPHRCRAPRTPPRERRSRARRPRRASPRPPRRGRLRPARSSRRGASAAPPSPSRTRARAARRLDRICASAGTADASPGVETRRRVSATLASTASSFFAMLSRRAGSRTSAAIARKRVSTPEKRSSPLRPAPPATQPTEVWFGPGSWSWPMSWERCRLRLAIAIW